MATIEKATKRLGNTKARRFQLTLNEVEKYDELKKYLTSLESMTYLISCKEIAPTTWHEHIHIFVCFKNAIKLSLKKCEGAHIEYCKGSVQQNIDYVKKDGKIIDEIGEVPRERGGSHTVKELSEIDSPDEIDWKEYNTWRRINEEKRKEESFMKMLSEIKEDKIKGPEVIYFTGDSGIGKTYSAYKYALNKYEEKDIGKITFNEGFADIVNPKAKCLVCEEFRPSDLKASKLLEFMDKYGASINVKGGFEYVRPETIIFASIFNPKYLYNDEEKNEQFTRRITRIIKLEKDCSTILK